MQPMVVFSLGVAALSTRAPCAPEAPTVAHAGRPRARPQDATVAFVL